MVQKTNIGEIQDIEEILKRCIAVWIDFTIKNIFSPAIGYLHLVCLYSCMVQKTNIGEIQDIEEIPKGCRSLD